MKRRNTLFTCFLLFVSLCSGVWVNAQTFNGIATNTAGNALIPSTGTGGCTVAPQNVGGTVFECNVTGLGANVKLLSVQINLTHTSDADLDIFLEAPGTLTQTTPQRIELAGDLGGTGDNFTNTQFCDNASVAITAGVAPFTGTFRPEGTLVVSCDPDGTGPLTAYAGNVTTIGAFTGGQNGIWKLRIFDDLSANSGTMISWSLTFGDPTCTFSGVTLPTLTINAVDPNTCGATNASVTAPTLACSSPISVFVDNTFLTTVAPGGTFTIPSLLIGPHTIRYQLSACDFVNQALSVVDKVPPVITCPSSVTINLGPGACSSVFTYDIGCTDNCPFSFSGTVNHPIDFNNGQAGIMFDVVNLSGNVLQLTQFTPSLDPGTWPVQVYVTTTANTWQGNQNNPAAWTLAGQQTVTSVGVNPGTVVPGFGITIPPGQGRGIYITSTTGFPMNYTNGTRQFEDANLRVSSNPGAGVPYPFGAAFISRAYNGGVTYQAVGADTGTKKLAGLDSGSEFPRGTTTQIYQCTDLAGNTATCSFSVTVLEYPNPISSLVCNDLVQVSVDQNCEAVVGADQVLEGGPYGCYDDYIVQLDKTAPFGNGPWVPAVLGPADVGKTYQVRVVDPENNDNKCWGNIKVEDKLPPQLVCRPADTLLCNQDPYPGLFPTGSGIDTFSAVGLPITTQEAQTKTFNIPVSLPSNAIITDVDFRMRVSSNATPGPFQAPWDFDLGVQLFNPGGNIEVWPFWGYGGCGAAPVFAIWDDDSPAAAACATLTTGGRSAILPPANGNIT
ncbi:MAG: HYR domain-containing protein, partial [Thermoanaerobaculia bacterium]|nr:HYR domain-containing protein [Thermoanaerobaculia bacterium]